MRSILFVIAVVAGLGSVVAFVLMAGAFTGGVASWAGRLAAAVVCLVICVLCTRKAIALGVPSDTTEESLDANAEGLTTDRIILALLLVLSFFLGSFVANNSDILMHLAVGKHMSEGSFSFGVDPFSWASEGAQGRPAAYWVHQGWLFSWLSYKLNHLVGGGGLVLIKAIMFVLSVLVLSRIGWKSGNRWFVLICLMMAALAISPRLLLQPTVVSFFFMVITLFVLYRAGLLGIPVPPPPRAVANTPTPDLSDAGAVASTVPSPAPALMAEQGSTGITLAPAPVASGPLAAPVTATAPSVPEKPLAAPAPAVACGPMAKECACLGCLWILPPLFALWANMDSWFILGPMLLGLAWVGTGLAKWLSGDSRVCGKTVGLVFGVSILACLINPFHVRAFQLPPELAYLALSLKLPLPDSVAAGGRAWLTLRQDPEFVLTVSPLTARYWIGGGGFNIASTAFIPLTLLGFAAFALIASVKAIPGAPKLHYGRFLVWLVFAVMALVMYRMIPFFMIVAAPLTALTLSEFLAWQQRQADGPAALHDRGLHLARFVSVPFMLLLLILAWPGWLHGSFVDFYSYNPRRVAWALEPDGSLRAAAETLKKLKDNNQCGNVFNTDLRIPDYCAWYAPGVKCAMDTRYALFVDHAGPFIRAKITLLAPQRPETDWQTLFEERGVDQVVFTQFARRPGDLQRWLRIESWPTDQPDPLTSLDSTISLRWWFDADHWLQRYGDNRSMVYSWSGLRQPPEWPANATRDEWNRQAFGVLPAEQMPRATGMPQPQQLSLAELYSRGLGPQPPAAMEAPLLGVYFQTQRQFQAYMRPISQITFNGALSNVQGLSGGGLTVAPTFAVLNMCWNGPTWVLNQDNGPPALPILMVRSARRAIDDNPYDRQSQLALLDAYDLLHKNQEMYWTRFQSGAVMRDRLRSYQRITAFYNLTLLQPDRFEYQASLADEYLRSGQIDLGVMHRQLAAQKLEQQGIYKPEFVKKYQEDTKALEKRLQLRFARLKERSAGKNALELAEYAVADPFQEEVGGRTIETTLGLRKKAMEILEGIDPTSLAQKERLRYLQLNFSILLEMGRAGDVVDSLQDKAVREGFPSLLLAQDLALVGGVLGNYEMTDLGLEKLEKTFLDKLKTAAGLHAASLLILPGMHTPKELAATLVSPLQSSRLGSVAKEYNDYFNIRTLRGIIALEAGNTRRAYEIFAAIDRDQLDEFAFVDLPIARRYFQLLSEQRKK